MWRGLKLAALRSGRTRTSEGPRSCHAASYATCTSNERVYAGNRRTPTRCTRSPEAVSPRVYDRRELEKEENGGRGGGEEGGCEPRKMRTISMHLPSVSSRRTRVTAISSRRMQVTGSERGSAFNPSCAWNFWAAFRPGCARGFRRLFGLPIRRNSGRSDLVHGVIIGGEIARCWGN